MAAVLGTSWTQLTGRCRRCRRTSIATQLTSALTATLGRAAGAVAAAGPRPARRDHVRPGRPHRRRRLLHRQPVPPRLDERPGGAGRFLAADPLQRQRLGKRPRPRLRGDIGNVGDNPFDLRGTNGRLRVGLQFDAPLTRLAERNVYRQSLIEYPAGPAQLLPVPRPRAARCPRHAAAAAAGRLELRAAPGGRARGDHAGRPGAAAASEPARPVPASAPGTADAARRRSRNSATPWPATW